MQLELQGPEAADAAAPEGFASPISMATPTSADASPVARSPQEMEEVDEFTAAADAAEPEAAMEVKFTQGNLVRVSPESLNNLTFPSALACFYQCE